MDIFDDEQLRLVLLNEVIYPMAEYLANKIKNKLNEFILANSPISTKTMRKNIVYSTEKRPNGCNTTIYIDTEAMQSEAQIGAYGDFNKFMSLDLRTSYYGQSISYQLVKWIEETGAHGHLGNNPFEPIGMFKNVYAELDSLIPRWISEYATNKGIRIERR